ncbi:MAG: hypothetical protein FWH32_07690 [Clostridiales bacterium]|nr:hypothetical protein [Clostridiales bacterium]
MVALVIGIIALALCAFSFTGIGAPFVAIVGLVLGIVAWVKGKKAYAADPTDGKAKAGKTMGKVVTIIGIIAIVISVLFVVGMMSLIGSGALDLGAIMVE